MSDPSFRPQRRHPRLAGYDYNESGSYFITICTHRRQPLLGAVEGNAMYLSRAGAMVREAWQELNTRHPGIAIDTEIALPDHLHAIVVLDDDPARMLSLSDAVHRYKSVTTKRYMLGVREEGWPPFPGRLWQKGFYDHVIRDEAELAIVRRYIADNVQRWALRRTGRR